MSSIQQVPDNAASCRHTAVVNYGLEDFQTHEAACHMEFARQIAALMDIEFAGNYDRARRYSAPLYFVPSATLLLDEARQLGIRAEQDLFGGVVAVPFMATKAISHPLIDSGACAPPGWSAEFVARSRDVVLRGFTAFSLHDARRAGTRLLESGPVRLKPTRARGAHGQQLISGPSQLGRALDELDEAELREHGLVLEEHLTEVTTCSVGRARVGTLQIAYYGTQRLTSGNDSEPVYGGSDLFLVRGDLNALLDHDLEPSARLAIGQASVFDAAASEAFPEMFASRRNYDVAQGLDAQGNWRSGVLEQSWRIGGATGAELAALRTFQSNGEIRVVRAACVEVYGGNDGALPCHATVHFQGTDSSIGPITKYTVINGLS